MKIRLLIFFLHLILGMRATDRELLITQNSKHILSTDAIKFIEDPPDPPVRIRNEYQDIDQTEQRNIRVNNYIKFEDKDKTLKIVFDQYQNTDDSNQRDTDSEGSHSQGYIGEQEVSDKRMVFKDDTYTSPELYTKKNNYRGPGIPLTSGYNPTNLNFQNPNNGNLNYIHPQPIHPYNIYHGYPSNQYASGIPEYSPISTNLAFPEQNLQVTPKYPRQKYPGAIFSRPGLYSGQVGSRPTSNYGSEYAAAYQGPYGQTNQPMNLAQRAISAVTGALTSIALYDDKQCVPRLLCEVSTGSSPRSPALLKATASLGPLLTLLQSYNGISSSPLFIFGRAAILGATSKGNPTTCRYAYPECPNDPDKLINYLNNHNGGFFRFFGQPQKQQQNLEQFYNQLSGQYGQLQQQNQQQINHGQPFAFQNPYKYHEQKSYAKMDNEIAASDTEARIQNKPINYLDYDSNEDLTKWRFPDEGSFDQVEIKPERESKRKAKRIKIANDVNSNSLKFPDDLEPVNNILHSDEEKDFIRKKKVVFFPNNNEFYYQTNYESTTANNLQEYVFDYKHMFFVKRPKYTESNDNSETLYVIRGNNDPRYPEIVMVRPGQKF